MTVAPENKVSCETRMPIAGNIGAFKAGLAGGWYVRTPERGKRDITQIHAVIGKGIAQGLRLIF